MILSTKALNLAEVKSMTKNLEEKKELESYLKTFSKISVEDAEKLTKELTALNSAKLKETDIVKIVDFLPRDAEELNKIVHEVTLSEEEINSILAIVKNF